MTVWDISPGNKCCLRYFFVHAVEKVCNLFPMSSGKGLLKKSSKIILLMILSGPKLYRKLEFQFGVLTLPIPLSCLWKTQISLQIFEFPLSRHAECYRPTFETSMLIFEVRGARAVHSGCNKKMKFCISEILSMNTQDIDIYFFPQGLSAKFAGKIFTALRNLLQHRRTIHEKSDTFSCTEHNYETPRKNNLIAT